MCGGFVLALGSLRPGLAANLRRQLAYALGRVSVYATAGAAAGYVGVRLTDALGPAARVQAALAVGAGALLLAQGLAAAGIRVLPRPSARRAACAGAPLLGKLWARTQAGSAFLGGVLNGLLPCGLVYAFLALAASSGGPLRGWAVMGLFGLGTVPVMALVGCGGSVIGLAGRRRLLRFAAWCVVLTGAISIARGLGFAHGIGPTETATCPLCPREQPGASVPGS
jgi:sulfite exporter TauE/SafE